MLAKLLAPFKLAFAIMIFIPCFIVLSCSEQKDECHVTKICTNISDESQ